MRKTNTKKQQQLEWRRHKIDELCVKGFSQSEIARMLDIDKSAVSRDIEYLRETANETIRNHIQKKLPYEYTKCISGLEEIIKEGWQIAINADKKGGDSKEKLQALSLIKDTYNTKMDLLTNASLLQDSIKYVEESKQNLLSNKKENSNIDYSNDIQGSTEINNNEIRSSESEQQYNEVY